MVASRFVRGPGEDMLRFGVAFLRVSTLLNVSWKKGTMMAEDIIEGGVIVVGVAMVEFLLAGAGVWVLVPSIALGAFGTVSGSGDAILPLRGVSCATDSLSMYVS